MLDIVITHYKEPWETGAPLFRMIALQRGIDFKDIRVILINDGSEGAIPKEKIEEEHYPFHTDVVTIPHGGISAARNAGIDASEAEWITFCDFDDTYASVYSLRDVLTLLPAENFDLLWGKMLVEDFLHGKDSVYKSPEQAKFVFTHYKFYRRSFLLENDIRFDTDLTYNEDSLFNAIIIAVLDYHRIGEIKAAFPGYIWCRRGNSVTNKDGAKDPATYGHFRRNWKVCDFYLEHLPKHRLKDMFVRTIYDTYYMLNTEKISREMHDRIAKEFHEELKKYAQYWYVPEKDILEKIQWLAKHELGEEDSWNLPADPETVHGWMIKNL